MCKKQLQNEKYNQTDHISTYKVCVSVCPSYQAMSISSMSSYAVVIVFSKMIFLGVSIHNHSNHCVIQSFKWIEKVFQ